MNREHKIENVAADAPILKHKVAARIAPAVALLLWGEQVFAGDDLDDGPIVPPIDVPEPTTLALLAAGAAGAAIVAGIKKRRNK